MVRVEGDSRLRVPSCAAAFAASMRAIDRVDTPDLGLLPTKATLASMFALVCAFLLLYSKILAKLIHDWGADENYSHGFLVVPLALYFAWERRDRVAALPVRPSNAGLLVILTSLIVVVAGVLGAELFLSRISMIALLAGVIWFVWGLPRLQALVFPIAFLILMIPIPTIVFNQIAFPLQLLASRFGEGALRACAIPVLREGNVIVLATTTLQVAEACSGIRSLVSLLTLGIVYGYFVDHRWRVRAAIALATVPIAILANAFRVAGTGIAAHYFGPRAAQGFFHTFSGWLVFLVAFVLLLGVIQLLRRVFPLERSALVHA